MSKPLGVGIIGAGPVTQAIHLPAISTLDNRLRVVHFIDTSSNAVSATVATVLVPVSITDTLLAPALATYARAPSGLMEISTGIAPTLRFALRLGIPGCEAVPGQNFPSTSLRTHRNAS